MTMHWEIILCVFMHDALHVLGAGSGRHLGFGIDVGGTLCKVVHIEPDAESPRTHAVLVGLGLGLPSPSAPCAVHSRAPQDPQSQSVRHNERPETHNAIHLSLDSCAGGGAAALISLLRNT